MTRRAFPRIFDAARCRRVCFAGVLPIIAVSLVSCRDGADDTRDHPGALPMPQELGIRVGISQTFSLLQASMVLNDVQYYARGFADTARMYVPGHEPMIGRADVVTRFAEMNVRLGITDFVRISDGHRVDGRVVLDSGRFEITAAQPFPRDALPASGRYWTHWMFTESGQWIIVRDSLAHSR